LDTPDLSKFVSFRVNSRAKNITGSKSLDLGGQHYHPAHSLPVVFLPMALTDLIRVLFASIRGQKVLLICFCAESFDLGGHRYYGEVCIGSFAAGEDEDGDRFCSGDGLFGERFFIQ